MWNTLLVTSFVQTPDPTTGLAPLFIFLLMVHSTWHLAQKFNILANSGLESALSLKLEVFPQGLKDYQISYIEHTKTFGYTPAFKYENILSSSSLFSSS